MEKIKMVKRDLIPCWYELSWRGEQGTIMRIHSDFAKSIRRISSNSPIIESYKKDFGFKKFSQEFNQDFGFEDSLKFLGQVDNFLEYLIPSCLVRKTADRKCRTCKGSGESDIFEGEKCLFCDGEGKQIFYDYDEAYAVSATLSLLFDLMNYPEVETSCPFSQLMCIRSVTIRNVHGGSLGGQYSSEVVGWMRKHGPGLIPEMVSAMRTVWQKMDGREVGKLYDHYFHSYISGEVWLLVDCPGDACGLHPSDHYLSEDSGYDFSCHNTDNPMQQLTLLTALAVLNDLVRKSQKKTVV